MKHIKRYCIIFALSTVCLSQEIPDKNEDGDFGLLKFTIQVIAEDNTPIKDALIHAAVDSYYEYKDRKNDFRGKSDDKGLFIVESKAQNNTEIEVTKPGYYRSNTDYRPPHELNQNFKSGDKILPWNPTIPIILKKIGKPIPMLVSLGRSNSDLTHYAPKINEEVGFDMMKIDWIKPFGTGEVADIFVLFRSEFISEENFKIEAKLRFPNPNDGLTPIYQIIGGESQLKYPRIAPILGYEVKLLDLINQYGKLKYPKQK